ncbi:hypothetical protein [Flavobacterium sp.]|uniref:hypothetical protein n=1 Tax=Flavobacterium sp. TaxID=239 RepID=UPI00261DD8D5|nr:hypothetical protein [Flavobacterium sp.]
MLNSIQKDLRELLELVRDTATYDATLAASQLSGKAIEPGSIAVAERDRKGARISNLNRNTICEENVLMKMRSNVRNAQWLDVQHPVGFASNHPLGGIVLEFFWG